jgi:hypothetical protein
MHPAPLLFKGMKSRAKDRLETDDLVRDTCKMACDEVNRGNKITVTSGKRTLFQIVPVSTTEVDLAPGEFKEFLKDLDELAQSAPEDNPVLQLRSRRRR